MNAIQKQLNTTLKSIDKSLKLINESYHNQIGGQMPESYNLMVKLPDTSQAIELTVSPADNIHQPIYKLLHGTRADSSNVTDEKKSKNYNTLVVLLNLLNQTDFDKPLASLIPTKQEQNDVESIIIPDKDYVFNINKSHKTTFRVHEPNNASLS
jgi:hypothetical protein